MSTPYPPVTTREEVHGVRTELTAVARGDDVTPRRRAQAPGTAVPPAGPPAPREAEPPVSPTRTRAGQLLRDIARQLNEASMVLSDEPSREAVDAALANLEAAREALSLLARERAAEGRRPATGRTRPALVRRAQLSSTESSPAAARSFCRETAEGWGLPPALVTSAVDIGSELVANAVQIATAPVVLAMELREDGLLVSVWDDGPGRPRLLPYRPGRSERGIGLRLVRQLSENWGWTDEQDGKWVWARLALPPGETPELPPA